jgi:flagellar basal-body rod protein FlgF
MIDRFAYTAMTGAKHAMGQLGNTAHNLANLQTPGFRELLSTFRAVPVTGARSDSRAFVVDSTPGVNAAPGTLVQTGNDLDVAIDGSGFFVVQRPDGSQAYTRMGKLKLDAGGWLLGAQGHPVMGENGAIQVPAGASQIQIQPNGAIHAVLPGENYPSRIDVIKRVDAPTHTLKLAGDGLFESDTELEHQPAVRLLQGAYEGSNVSMADAMVQMIKQNRLFDLNMRLVQAAEQNAKQAGGLISLSRV